MDCTCITLVSHEEFKAQVFRMFQIMFKYRKLSYSTMRQNLTSLTRHINTGDTELSYQMKMKLLIFAGLAATIAATAPQGSSEELALLKSKLLLFQNVTGASDAEVDRLWNQGQQTRK